MSYTGKNQKLHVIFSGRVQGVGFRYTVCELASQFELTGCVRNLHDGDVELIAEGLESDLVGLLNTICGSRLKRNIMNKRVEWKPKTGGYDRFGIER